MVSQLEAPTVVNTSRAELFCPVCGAVTSSLEAEFRTPDERDIIYPGRVPVGRVFAQLVAWRPRPCGCFVSGGSYKLLVHGLPGWSMFVPHSWRPKG